MAVTLVVGIFIRTFITTVIQSAAHPLTQLLTHSLAVTRTLSHALMKVCPCRKDVSARPCAAAQATLLLDAACRCAAADDGDGDGDGEVKVMLMVSLYRAMLF